MEATGHARWFERLLAELKFELWIGDPASIKAARVRKQKTDRQDAQLLLRLLVEARFPWIWVPSPENRDLRQLKICSGQKQPRTGAYTNFSHCLFNPRPIQVTPRSSRSLMLKKHLDTADIVRDGRKVGYGSRCRQLPASGLAVIRPSAIPDAEPT
jgi:hypothetical protein